MTLEARHFAALEALAAEDFAACRGDMFHWDGGEPATLEAVDFDPASPGRFSLLFSAPGAASAEQGIYLLAHERLGELGLFLVPLGPASAAPGGDAASPACWRYEAVISRS
ncbi:MAG: hypothetical protein CME40_03845 [Haliea sp.]|nr:hypothetical protein [Haliea sp.]